MLAMPDGSHKFEAQSSTYGLAAREVRESAVVPTSREGGVDHVELVMVKAKSIVVTC